MALKWIKFFDLRFFCNVLVFVVIGTQQLYSQNLDLKDHFTKEGIHLSPVKIDGNTLFEVGGISSYPSETRAEAIVKNIKKVAENKNISISDIKKKNDTLFSAIIAGKTVLIRVFDTDAAIEGVNRNILAEATLFKIKTTIEKYRNDRLPEVIKKNTIIAVISLVILIVVLLLVFWVFRMIRRFVQKRIDRRLNSVENISYKLIKSNDIWRVINLFFITLRFLLVASLVIYGAYYILGLFPWTNELSISIFNAVADPLSNIGSSIVNYIPKLIFLVILFILTKYLLKLIELFFVGIQEERIKLNDFRPEWAMSTYKIIRTVVIIFAIVIAYPYIPGSDSVAFKGVSVFVGILISLGSSAFIGNVVAGYSMIYRNAFRNGDLIEVDGQRGFVVEQKLLVTRLRSPKNEEIVIPNSILLNNKIVNYSNLKSDKGIILHTNVGIGYETPWRQVDAMLKLAANRTDGLLKEPQPFVLKKLLGDYAVTYEINAYCVDVERINTIYSELNQHILDVFNENKVQIMTPSYVSDPDIEKMVPEDKWDIPLAKNK
ncbi:mechanosensitive ion channel family protein [Mariniflexile maritimum]|uniref:mechanosensitive ion channel family protein n=1 Tax=Mariniflexile maritimum TaxID=2682493 RepID=UPI0012F6A0F6|nr:mechanosensitive ion channel domain-containing protein [Mariniflexile maritimum]